MNAMIDFVPVWTLILGAGIFFYVLLDGFDLGVGMLYGFMPDTRSRNTVMNAIAPVWDGNETWLVLGGVGLLSAFPLAFAIIIPALYFPIAIMLLALVFRGVAFEFRFRDAERRTFWDHGFFCGSLVATFAQGVMLGAFVQGFRVQGRIFTGTAFDFLTPFSLVTGLALIFGYGLLGAGWLVLKTEGDIQVRARRYGLLVPGRRPGRPPGGERLDAVDQRTDRPALVLLAEHRASVAGSRRQRAGSLRHLARALGHIAIRRLHRRDRAVCPLLRRHRDQPVAHDRSASLHALAGRIVAQHPGLPPGRHALPAAGHPFLHGLVLLGLPREGARRRGLSFDSRAGPRSGRA